MLCRVHRLQKPFHIQLRGFPVIPTRIILINEFTIQITPTNDRINQMCFRIGTLLQNKQKREELTKGPVDKRDIHDPTGFFI